MLDATQFPALRGLESDILDSLTQKIGKPVEVLAVAEAVAVDAEVEPLTEN